MVKKTILKNIIMTILVVMLALSSTACSCKNNDEIIEEPQVTYAESVTHTLPDTIDETGYKVYYFDGIAGKDENSGLSYLAPKKSLKELSSIASKASEQYPVKILLKCGSVFEGDLVLSQHESTKEKPLIISSYGDEKKGRPKLVGLNRNDDNAYPVVLVERGNIRISNLEITDPYAYQGIYIKPIVSGAFKNVVIENCYVHDVNFFWNDKFDKNNPPSTLAELNEICPSFNSLGSLGRRYYRNYGGIIFYNGTSAKVGASWFEDVYALNNIIENVARTGLYMATRWSNCPGVGYGDNKFTDDTGENNDHENGIGYFMHKNVNFIGNKLDLIGGDGIILAGEDSFLEHNVCYRANYLGCSAEYSSTNTKADQYYNAAIWVFDSKNVYFQYNEAGYTFLRNGAGDGEGFDIDNSCRDIYFQYNYAHHNEGGGLLICNNTASLLRYDIDGNCLSPNGSAESLLGDWGNNYCRNNVFAFNGKVDDASRSAFVTVARQCNDFYAYNNTVIFSNAKNGDIAVSRSIITVEDTKASLGHVYASNIFVLADENNVGATVKFNNLLNGAVYDNNLYHNTGNVYQQFSTPEANPIIDINPTINFNLENFDGFDKVALFNSTNSSIFSSGKLRNGLLKKDILGNDAENVKYLGAFAR